MYTHPFFTCLPNTMHPPRLLPFALAAPATSLKNLPKKPRKVKSPAGLVVPDKTDCFKSKYGTKMIRYVLGCNSYNML